MTEHFVVVSVGGTRHLFRVADLQEILSLMALAPVRRASGRCRGVANLRGSIVPVFDLASASAPLSPSRFILIARAGEGPIGLIVDEIHDVVGVHAPNLARRSIGGGREVIFARLDEDVLSIIDPADVLLDEHAPPA